MSQELIHLLDAAKSDMVVGLKLREASLLKLMLGQYLLFMCVLVYLFIYFFSHYWFYFWDLCN